MDIVPAVVGADATTSARGAGLVHQAFVYESADDFVAEMAPVVRDAVARGDAAFVASKRANLDGLREELGSDADEVTLLETGAWRPKPYDRLQHVRQIVAGVPAGGRAVALGEPLWGRSDAERREWARYESIINLALADAPLRFVCLYDGATLPDEVLEYATCTHPERIADGGCDGCDGYVPAAAFDPGAVPAPPPGARSVTVDDAAAFRVAATDIAAGAGLRGRDLEDFVLAANEIATNGLVHGRAPVRAHLWHDERTLVCRVDDVGDGVADPLAGWLPPERASAGGWGLVLARRLCASVDTVRDARGSAVVLHFPLRSA